MGAIAARRLTWATALELGRVSNLPTVWSNTLAGIVLAGAAPLEPRLLPVLFALSAMYVGGMYLNDAFDAASDARQRPERPIPSGRADRRTVFGVGFGLLAAGPVLLLLVGFAFPNATGIRPFLSGSALAAAIVLYDAWHKSNPLSPLLMGICRMLVYITAAFAFMPSLPLPVWVGSLLLVSYLIGLTYLAKQENLSRPEHLWPLVFLALPIGWGFVAAAAVPANVVFVIALLAVVIYCLFLIRAARPGNIARAVSLLIAGIALVDAILIAGNGAPLLALVAATGFPVTLASQRWVAGT